MGLTLLGHEMRPAELDSAVQELGAQEGPIGLSQTGSEIKKLSNVWFLSRSAGGP